MSKKTKWSLAGVATIAIAIIVGLGAAKRGNKGVEVRIEPVEKRDLVSSVTAGALMPPAYCTKPFFFSMPTMLSGVPGATGL